ncbi:MAG: CinA family nicotinamide mononucleotide deamidase-related protein [Bradymonadia bacterium]
MQSEILIIGDELLDGRVSDLHTATIAHHLEPLGLTINRQQALPDHLETLQTAFVEISERAELCIVTGGLGPTSDDLTVAAFAAAAQVSLAEDAETWQHIVTRYAPALPPETNRKQALVPEGATVLATSVGTAPGLVARFGRCTFFLLPGVPREMHWHLEEHVRPALARMIDEGQLQSAPSAHQRTLTFVTVGESALAEGVASLGLGDHIQLSYLAHPMGVDVRLQSTELDAINHAAEAIIAQHPDAFLSDDGTGLVEALLQRLKGRKLTAGTAESCTGGLVAGALTAIPGSSAVVLGGIVAYSNSVKMARLAVPEAVLIEHGAVSEPCAAAMARGAREALGCDVAMSITGIAGPGGGTAEKPVGTVCFGWSGPDFDRTQTHLFRGDREAVRRKSMVWALAGLWREVGR